MGGAFARERGASQFVSAACELEFSDRWLSGQKQQTVNLPAHVAYGGSNPPLSTRKALASQKVTTEERDAESPYLVTRDSSLFGCGSNSVVESQPSKLLVAGSIPVSRSRRQ